MNLKHYLLLASALTLVSACDQFASDAPAPSTGAEAPAAVATETATPAALPEIGPKADAMRTAEIDWTSARRDLTGQEKGSDELVTVASSGEPAVVPVLLPTGIVTPASAERGVMFRQTSDGYFASYPGEAYDIVINGTNLIAGTAGEAGTPPSEPVFTSSVAGAQLSLSRYGANYLIEFECNIDLAAGSDTCITEDEAFDMAEKLIVAGTR
ncbi:MAG: hypothetical protein ABJG15_19275 [Hyphomonadaceae bacterium]